VTLAISPHGTPDVETHIVVLVVVDACLEVVIVKVEQVRGERSVNVAATCHGTKRVVGRREVGHLSVWKKRNDMIWMTGPDKQVLGLSAMGDDGNKTARNVQPHSGHLHACGSGFMFCSLALNEVSGLMDHWTNDSERGELEVAPCELNGHFGHGEVE